MIPYFMRRDLYNIITNLNNIKIVEDLFFVKDVGFNYWSIGKGKKRDGNSIGDRIFYSGKINNKKDMSYLKGRDINRYCISEPNNFLKWNYNHFLHDGVDIFRYSREILEITPKIFYRQTSNRIIATIDYNKNLCDKTLHTIVPRETPSIIDLKYLLALLNSELFNFLYKYISQETKGRTFAQVKTVYIKQLPVKICNSSIQSKVVLLVDKILSAKANDKLADTTKLENQIDQLIYKLYDLTEEEIAIIEGGSHGK